MRIGIIGYGRFGKLWTKCLADIGHDVLVYDKKFGLKNNKVKSVLNVDILFLLVPISKIKNVCEEIADKLGKNTIVVDACSVKVFPVKIMKKYLPAKQPIIATHPLFGPDSVSRLGMTGQKIVICPLRTNREQLEGFESLLKKMKLKIVRTTPLDHDKQLAKSQALVHFIGRALARIKLKKQKISTPDFDFLLRVNDLVNNDTWQLFLDMQTMNPFAANARRRLLAALTTTEKNINNRSNNLPSLRQQIEQIDKEIITLVGRRLSTARKIGRIKQTNGLPILDTAREKKLKRHHFSVGHRLGLSRKLAEKIFNLLIKESRRIQK